MGRCIRTILGVACWSFLSAVTFFSGAVHANLVGTLKGSFGVQSSGASYSIPIAVPPGLGGMQPDLAIGYQSLGGGGRMGVGWGLGGLSAITRCNKTLVQDGVIHKVDFSWNDPYCLNGQRLIAVSGEYGKHGTKYRTELDGFSEITSHGTTGNGATRFVVKTKSGQTLHFGNTVDSRLKAAGRISVYTWANNEVVDAVGNSIVFSYGTTHSYTEYWPTEITYTHNPSSNQSALHRVEFVYDTETDLGFSYIHTSKIKQTKRLIKIITYANGVAVREYQFRYKTRTNKPSLLLGVKVCAGTECLPENTFKWQESIAPSPSAAKLFDGGNQTLSSNANRYADLNGDGVTDLIGGQGDVVLSSLEGYRSVQHFGQF